jgi:hypothetical protein
VRKADGRPWLNVAAEKQLRSAYWRTLSYRVNLSAVTKSTVTSFGIRASPRAEQLESSPSRRAASCRTAVPSSGSYAGEPTGLAEQARDVAVFSARHSALLAQSSPDHAGAVIVHDHDAQDLYTSIQGQDPALYVHENTSGALALFAKAFQRLRSALTPAVSVRHKPPMVDVSVLVTHNGRPSLVGICNDRYEASRVELELAGAAPRAGMQRGCSAHAHCRGLAGGRAAPPSGGAVY